VSKGDGKHKHPNDAYRAFLKAVSRGVADLEGRTAGLKSFPPDDVEKLTAGKRVIDALLKQAGKASKPSPRAATLEVQGQRLSRARDGQSSVSE
jgi:hypothetical protein